MPVAHVDADEVADAVDGSVAVDQVCEEKEVQCYEYHHISFLSVHDTLQ